MEVPLLASRQQRRVVLVGLDLYLLRGCYHRYAPQLLLQQVEVAIQHQYHSEKRPKLPSLPRHDVPLPSKNCSFLDSHSPPLPLLLNNYFSATVVGNAPPASAPAALFVNGFPPSFSQLIHVESPSDSLVHLTSWTIILLQIQLLPFPRGSLLGLIVPCVDLHHDVVQMIMLKAAQRNPQWNQEPPVKINARQYYKQSHPQIPIFPPPFVQSNVEISHDGFF